MLPAPPPVPPLVLPAPPSNPPRLPSSPPRPDWPAPALGPLVPAPVSISVILSRFWNPAIASIPSSAVIDGMPSLIFLSCSDFEKIGLVGSDPSCGGLRSMISETPRVEHPVPTLAAPQLKISGRPLHRKATSAPTQSV